MSRETEGLVSESLVRESIHKTTYNDTEPTIVGDYGGERSGGCPGIGLDGKDGVDEVHQADPGEFEPCHPDEPKSLYPVRELRELKKRSLEPNRRNSRSPSGQKKIEAAKQQPSAARPPNPLENWPLYALIILVCLAALYLQNFLRGGGVTPSSTLSPGDRRMVTLREHLRSLRDTFGDQPEHNWQIIRTSVVDMLNGTDVYSGPAVILLLASEKNERFAKCLAEQVATALSFTFEDDGRYGTIAPDDLEISEDVATHVIENRCRETIEKHRWHVVLASHLEKWKPDAAMMLHPLCDQENALYKNATYILTVFAKHEAVAGKRERKEYDKLAEDALNRAWGAMDTNQRHAIISRVTGNVVLVRDDSASCIARS
ncbi:torsin-1A-interacting protein 1 [Ixodes scapularis]|uniref:torsin-1A-interacting protein 1 n=1 Tax=Ixodes scapularis TaxID=6945 RepID=UPI001C3804E8|nr:torsin-1A-interacting protein 1 [Ixodes scapularis]